VFYEGYMIYPEEEQMPLKPLEKTKSLPLNRGVVPLEQHIQSKQNNEEAYSKVDDSQVKVIIIIDLYMKCDKC
jgi:hypothetical protein